MRTLRHLTPFILLLLSLHDGISQTLIGQDTTRKTITTEVAFLNLTPDARAAGMGDVGVATSADANSSHWNPGKLARVDEENGMSLSYTPWLSKIVNDMFVVYLSGFYKIKKLQVVSASMRYFSVGEITFNTGPDPNQQLGKFNPREFAFDVTYSRILTKSLSIGGSLRYIHSNMVGNITLGSGGEARPGNSVAVDIGLFFRKPSRSQKSTLALGMAITNIGSKISYFDAKQAGFIPTNMRLGGAYTRHMHPLHDLTVALDINKLLVPSPTPGSRSKNLLKGIFGSFSDAEGGFKEEIQEFTLSTGLEYEYKKTFSGRLGYFLEADEKGGRQYLTIGIGAKVRHFGLDIAYMHTTNGRQQPLSETIRLTLMVHFGKKGSTDNNAASDNTQ